jgi:transcriptional regulator with XRE-family HTH domain
MGTTQSVISQIEGGGHVPSLAMLARVAKATGRRFEFGLVAEAC